MSEPTEVEPTEKQRAAFTAGRDAFVAGFDSTVCPYVIDEADSDQLGRLWVRGWVQARHRAQGPRRVRRQAPAGLLKTREGMPMRARKGERAVTNDTTTNNPAWVLACLHSETEVTDVDGSDIPDLGDRRPRRAAAAPVAAGTPAVAPPPAAVVP